MIIDIYCHVGKSLYDELRFGVQKLIEQMDSCSITLCFVSPFSPVGSSLYEANMNLYRKTRRFKDRIRCVCRLDPKLPEQSSSLAFKLKKLGFKAIELDPFEQAFRLNDNFLTKFLESIVKLDMPLIIRSGLPSLSEPAMISSLAGSFSKIKMIMTHGGQLAMHGLGIQDAVDALACNDNLYLETSGIPETGHENLVQRAVELGLENRILFGSDTPVLDIEVELARVKAFASNPDMLEKFMFRNASKLFKERDKSIRNDASMKR
ncbi:MAG: amidohydrolase family protein [Conexivisphaerales archaeon]